MRSVVNHLIQLQDLTLIRGEQKVSGIKTHLEELDTSIKTLVEKLPNDTRSTYKKLEKKDHTVITPIADGNCASCGLKLPISLVQAVRIAKSLHSCPNCARLLYYPESVAKRQQKKVRHTATRKVGISRFSSHTLMVPDMKCTTKAEAIEELSTKMEAEGFVDHADKLIEGILRRESILGTGVDHGLAFPHARGIEGGALALALGVSKKGIKWNDGEKALTHIIFLLAIPTAAAAFYLKLLAGLTESFMQQKARKLVLDAKDQDQLWKAVATATKSTIK